MGLQDIMDFFSGGGENPLQDIADPSALLENVQTAGEEKLQGISEAAQDPLGSITENIDLPFLGGK